MTFDWHDYLTLGQMLAALPGEAERRSAVSRAYYAAYCASRGWLLQRGYVFSTRRHAHRALWYEFIYQTNPDVWVGLSSERLLLARQIGNEGHRLRKARERADYDDAYPRLPVVLSKEMQRAVAIHEWLADL